MFPCSFLSSLPQTKQTKVSYSWFCCVMILGALLWAVSKFFLFFLKCSGHNEEQYWKRVIPAEQKTGLFLVSPTLYLSVIPSVGLAPSAMVLHCLQECVVPVLLFLKTGTIIASFWPFETSAIACASSKKACNGSEISSLASWNSLRCKSSGSADMEMSHLVWFSSGLSMIILIIWLC